MADTAVILGIESSCDETAASVIEVTLHDAGYEAKLLSNVVHSQMDHQAFGGVVPELAARAHVDYADKIIEKALQDSGYLDPEKIISLKAIAATTGPGLVGGVMVGMMSGKAMAVAHDVPFMPINHLEGHALSVRLTEQCVFPYLLLLVSGGHCQLLWVTGYGQYQRLGTTIDDAVGEAFDKTAKLIGLPQPGGPNIEKMAKSGDPTIPLPKPLRERAGVDFSFSGLKTAIREVAMSKQPLSTQDQADLSASFQAAAAGHLCQQTRKTIKMQIEAGYDQARLVVAGGVAANQYIRTELAELCDELGWVLVVPPPKLCTDNGAMIAWAAAEKWMAAKADNPNFEFKNEDLNIAARPRWPLDQDPDGARIGSGKKGFKA